MTRYRPLLTGLVLIAGLLAPSMLLAHGDQHDPDLVFNVNHVRYDVSGTGLSVVSSPETLALLRGGGGLKFYVADRPFVLYDNRGDEAEQWAVVMQSMVGLDLHGAIGFGPIELGLHLPVVPVTVWGSDPTGGDFPVPDSDSAGVGDLTLLPKVRILDPAKGPFGLGISLPVSFPTGAGSPFLSEGGVSFAVDVLAELRLKRFRALVNIAPLHLRPRLEYGGFVRQFGMSWKAGLEVTALTSLALRAEVWGTLGYQGEHSRTTAEWAVSVALRPSQIVSLELGAGSGLGGLGTPVLRAFAGVRFTAPDRSDRDGDQWVDSEDQCPDDPEDFDGWDDDDGCPDLDNDADGIPDASDACPLNAENLGVGDDSDGCPDLEPVQATEPAEAQPNEIQADDGLGSQVPPEQTAVDEGAEEVDETEAEQADEQETRALLDAVESEAPVADQEQDEQSQDGETPAQPGDE